MTWFLLPELPASPAEDILERPAPPADRRLPYGPHPSQFADLRLPAASGPHPIVLLLHGGYWRDRYDLTYLGHVAEALRREGVATWNIEYRRVGDGGGFPATLHDVVHAGSLLSSVASQHNLDLGHVACLGHSAGGQLALWLAKRPLPFPLRGVVALAPVADLRLAADRHLSDDATQSFLGGDPAEVPDRYAASSPAALLPLGVRQVLVHGDDDDAVPYEMSVRYTESARAAGDDVTFQALPATGHFEPVDPDSAAWPHVRDAALSLLGD